MIPNFKTYLEESIWGDIRKKSLGQEERMEDAFNMDKLRELLDINYKQLTRHEVGYNTDKCVVVPAVIGEYVYYVEYVSKEGMFFGEGGKEEKDKKLSEMPETQYYVTIDEDMIYDVNAKSVQLLSQTYDLYNYIWYRNNVKSYAIFPKDGRPITIKFFLEVLDFLLENMQSRNKKHPIKFGFEKIRESS